MESLIWLMIVAVIKTRVKMPAVSLSGSSLQKSHRHLAAIAAVDKVRLSQTHCTLVYLMQTTHEIDRSGRSLCPTDFRLATDRRRKGRHQFEYSLEGAVQPSNQ
jgi:hypothetical protein